MILKSIPFRIYKIVKNYIFTYHFILIKIISIHVNLTIFSIYDFLQIHHVASTKSQKTTFSLISLLKTHL